jgi:hypothetical protein
MHAKLATRILMLESNNVYFLSAMLADLDPLVQPSKKSVNFMITEPPRWWSNDILIASVDRLMYTGWSINACG